MSTKNVQTIIGKAMVDPAFYTILFSDPSQALKGYDLTREEAEALKSLDARQFDAVSADLQASVSKVDANIDMYLDDGWLDKLGLNL